MSDGLKFAIKIEDMSAKILTELKKKTEDALYVMGINAVEGSVDAITREDSPDKAVDTGRLRASISFITPDQSGGGEINQNSQSGDKLTGKAPNNAVVVGSNVNYAAYVHNGVKYKHKEMAARPFLTHGIQNVLPKMQRQVEKVFKGEL